MEQATKVLMDYVEAFEQTYDDDDWSRLTQYFQEDMTYEVRGGPFACKISGRDAVLKGLKKSIDGMDRRCTDRKIELIDGPNIVSTDNAHELSIGWCASYHYGDAPKITLPGRSIFTISGGVIVQMRDEYDDKEMVSVGAWMQEYGEGLDGSYV